MRPIYYIISLFLCICISDAYAINKKQYPGGVAAQFIVKRGSESTTGCLGAFIDSWHVITAAHCVVDIKGLTVDPHDILVQYPDKHLVAIVNNLDPSTMLAAQSVDIHPDFKGTSYADIAVIKLSKSVSLPNNDTDKTLAHGNLAYTLNTVDYLEWNVYVSQIIKDQFNNSFSEINTKTTKLYPGNKARENFTKLKNDIGKCGITSANINIFADIEQNLIDNFIFAFIESENEIEEPYGSSGSPIIAYDTNNHNYWYLEGLLSGGNVYECGSKYYAYEIYVSNYTFASWIDSVVGHPRKKRSSSIPTRSKKLSEIAIPLTNSGIHYSLSNNPHNATGFIASNGTLGFPNKLVWKDKEPTQFTINLKDNQGTLYPVHLIGTLGYEACPFGTLNSVQFCNTTNQKSMILNFADNHHLPNNITLTGSFKLLRQGWHDPSFTQVYRFDVIYQN